MALGPLGVLGGAFGGLVDGPPDPTPTASRPPSRPPAPIIAGPAERVIGQRRWDLEGRLPRAIADGAGYTIRVYLDGKRVRERALPAGEETFRVPGLRLRRGVNRVAAAIRGPSGEGPRSSPVRVVVDQQPPPLVLREPAEGDTINARRVLVRGQTQPDSTLEILNQHTRKRVSAKAPAGRFSIAVSLRKGWNRLLITAIDPGGNRTVSRVRVRRGEGTLTVALSISSTLVRLSALPRTLRLRVEVRDADGKPLDDALVVFSLSPPGLPTATYEARTVRGIADWPSVTIPRDGAVAGEGFATVLVELTNGRRFRDTVAFRFA